MQRGALHLFRFPDKSLIHKVTVASLCRDPLHLFRRSVASLPFSPRISSAKASHLFREMPKTAANTVNYGASCILL
jgi:hypothetical protein